MQLRQLILLWGMIVYIFQTTVFAGYIPTSGADVLNIEPGAREAGIANSFVSIADTPNTLFYNPAGLGSLKSISGSAGYINFFSELNYNFMAIAVPLKIGGIGLGINYAGVKDFYEISYGKETATKIGYSSFIINSGYGIKLTPNYSIGIVGKYLNSNIAGISGKAFALDIGGIAGTEALKLYDKVENNLRAGFVLRNIGTKIKYISQEEKLPTRVDIGLYYKPLEIGALTFEFNYFANYNILETLTLKSGIEFLPDYFITPRLGLKISPVDTVFTIGASIGTKIWHNNLKFDFAYGGKTELGSSFYFTLNILKPEIPVFRKQGELFIRNFPDFFKKTPKLLFTETFKKEPVRIKIEDITESKAIEKISQEFQKALIREIKNYNELVIATQKPVCILQYRITKPNKKYIMEAYLLDYEKKEIKKYRIKFKQKNVINKIAKKLIERIYINKSKYFYSTLSILSFPKDAEVYINGEFTGNTPLYLSDVLIGKYNLQIGKKGYKSVSKNIKVIARQDNKYFFDLKAGYIMPEVFNLEIQAHKDLSSKKKLNEFAQIFEMLLKEKAGYFKDYVMFNKEKKADIKIYLMISNLADEYKISVKMKDTQKDNIIKNIEARFKNDSQIPAFVDEVLNNIIEYIVELKNTYKTEEVKYGALRGYSLPRGLKFVLSIKRKKETYITPFIITNLEPGEYKLNVLKANEIIYSDWIIIEESKTNSINLFDYYYDDFSKLKKKFWDRRYYNISNPQIKIKKIKTKKGTPLLYMVSKIKENNLKELNINNVMFGLISKEFITFPFEIKIKFKAKKFAGTSLYLGINDNQNKKVFVKYSNKGYFFFKFTGDQEDMETRYVTTFGNEDKVYHTLKIVYDGFTARGYVDDIKIDEIPLYLGEKIKFCVLSETTKGKLSIALKEFELKRKSIPIEYYE